MKKLKEVNHSSRGHHEYGPSSMKNRKTCPAWINRESSDTWASDEGTMLHEAVDARDPSKIETSEQEHCYAECVTRLEDIEARVGAGARAYHEQWLDILGGESGGTPDFVLVDGDICWMRDFKFGRIEVDHPKDNLQLWAYSIGIFEKFPEVEEIDAGILQPRRNFYASWRYRRKDDLPRFKAEISKIVRDAKKAVEDGLYRPEPTNCNYCGRKATCPALGLIAIKISQNMEETKKVLDKIGTLDENAFRDSEKLSLLMEWAPALEGLSQEIKKKATSVRLEEGVEIPGYEIKYRQAPVKIKEPTALLEADIEELAELDEKDLVGFTTGISISKLKKFIEEGSARGDKSKTSSRVMAKLLAEGIATQGEETPYLAKERKHLD